MVLLKRKGKVKQAPEDYGHPQHSVRKQLVVSTLILFVLIAVSALVILYGKGYRIFVQEGEPKVSKTGILNVNSSPTGAQVFINDELTTATNNSLNLTPGKYHVKIAKEGYQDWVKDFDIQREVVSDANATLFPKAPSLQSISTFGIQATVIDPTGTKLAFNIASNSAAKRNGIYVYDMTARSFPVLVGQSDATQIANDTADRFSQAQLAWSPDGRQLIASIAAVPTVAPTYYLLDVNQLNETPRDITTSYEETLALWKQQRQDKEAAQLKSLKKEVQKFAGEHFSILSWSPDDSKILYQASASGTMPIFHKPRFIGNNALYERRDLEQGAVYVYDLKEDFNTRVVEPREKICTVKDPSCTCNDFIRCQTPFTWFPDSRHLMYLNDRRINVIEEDGSNLTVLYAGPFVADYVFPWPDGSKVVILTNFNSADVAPTLYSIGLK